MSNYMNNGLRNNMSKNMSNGMSKRMSNGMKDYVFNDVSTIKWGTTWAVTKVKARAVVEIIIYAMARVSKLVNNLLVYNH